MEKKQRVIVYGNSVVLAGIEARLRVDPNTEVVSCARTDHLEDLAELHPDVVIFDVDEEQSEFLQSQLQSQPDLLLIGIDPESHEVLLTGQATRSITLDQIMKIVRRRSNRTNYNPSDFHRKNHFFQTKKGETKMKNISKRTKSIVTIAGSIVVLALVAALVITQTPVGGLLGVTKVSITPSNASIVQGATIGLQVNSNNCAWKSSNVNVATLQSTAIGKALFKGVGPGTTTITANCGIAGTASTTLTVVPPPTATPVPLPTNTPAPAAPVISPDATNLGEGGSETFSTGDASCTWRANSSFLSPSTGSGASFTVTVARDLDKQYTVSITATCAGGTATETFKITPIIRQ